MLYDLNYNILKKAELYQIIETFLNTDNTLATATQRGSSIEQCINQITLLPTDIIIEACHEQLNQVNSAPDAEISLLLLLDGLQMQSPESAFDILKTALLHPSTEDKEFYANGLGQYPQEQVSAIFIEAIPKIKPFDSYSGYALEKILDKLLDWRVPLDKPIIKHLLKDPAFRVQRLIIPYVLKHDPVSYKRELKRLLANDDIYDDKIALQVKQALDNLA